MKTILLMSLALNLLLGSVGADVFTFDKDDPFIVISVDRAREIVLSVKNKESIELLFGSGIKRGERKHEYPTRTPPGIRPSGFAGRIIVEYDANGLAIQCEVTVQSVVGSNLQYPKD